MPLLNLLWPNTYCEGAPSHKKILEKAVKHQRKIYGKSVARYRSERRRKGSEDSGASGQSTKSEDNQ